MLLSPLREVRRSAKFPYVQPNQVLLQVDHNLRVSFDCSW